MRRFRAFIVVLALLALTVMGAASALIMLASPHGALADNTTCPSLYYDGWLEAYGADYTTVHNASDADIVTYLTTDFYVGQDFVGSTVYHISRGCLFFDTSAIPANAVISSASIILAGEYDSSDTDFDVIIVKGRDLHTPLIVSDYGNECSEVVSMSTNTISTAAFTTAYSTWYLNANGVGQIVRGGMTTFGVRSSNDISLTQPTQREYVSFKSSEAGVGYRPELLVVYTIPSVLGEPLTLSINSVSIFDSYKASGDNLMTIEYKCMYDPLPTNPASSYYSVQLYHGAITPSQLIGQTSLPNWGHAVASLYFAGGLEKSWTYTVIIIGPTGTYVSYDTVDADWRGSNANLLDAWCRAAALRIGITYNTTIMAYVEGTLKLDENGATIFLAGIPGLDSLRPALFITSTVQPEQEAEETYTPYNPSSTLGPYITNALSNTAILFGITSNMLAGIIMIFLLAALIAVLKPTTGGTVGGVIVGLPLIGLFVWLHIAAMAAIVVVAFVAFLLAAKKFWLSET